MSSAWKRAACGLMNELFVIGSKLQIQVLPQLNPSRLRQTQILIIRKVKPNPQTVDS